MKKKPMRENQQNSAETSELGDNTRPNLKGHKPGDLLLIASLKDARKSGLIEQLRDKGVRMALCESKASDMIDVLETILETNRKETNPHPYLIFVSKDEKLRQLAAAKDSIVVVMKNLQEMLDSL